MRIVGLLSASLDVLDGLLHHGFRLAKFEGGVAEEG